jgi:hypothetical protein
LSGAVALLWILGVNAVPAWGLFACGWGTGTALVLYWCENVLAALLVALRVAIFVRFSLFLNRRHGRVGHLSQGRYPAAHEGHVVYEGSSFSSKILLRRSLQKARHDARIHFSAACYDF